VTIGTAKRYNVTKLDEAVHFLPVTKVWTETSEHHLAVHLNYNYLWEGLQNIDVACRNALELQEHRYRPLKKKAQDTVDKCSETFNELKEDLLSLDQLFRPPKKRQKRFLSILAGLGIGALTGLGLEKLIGGSGTTGLGHEAVSVLQAHETSIVKDEDKIRKINDTLRHLAASFVTDQTNVDLELNLEKVLEVVTIEAEHLYRTQEALLKLLGGELSPALLKPTTLRKELNRIQRRLKERENGRRLAFSNMGTFYTLPTKYRVTGEREIVAVKSLPTTRASKPYDVYKLLKATINVSNSSHDWVIDEEELLAVSKDRTQYQILQEHYIKSCPVIEEVRCCKTNNILHKDWSLTCLSALYHGLWDVANDVCEPYVMPDKTYVETLGESSFLVFHPRETSILINCGEQQDIERLKGLFRLDLDGCTVSTNTYFLEGSRQLEESKLTVNSSNAWKIEDIVTSQGHESLEEIIRPLTLEKPLKVRDIAPLVEQEDLPVHSFINYGVSGLLVLAVTAGIYVICKARRSGRETGVARHEEIHLNVTQRGSDPEEE